MYLKVEKLLGAEQLASIDAVLAGAVFVAGRATAGAVAGRVKNNLQMDKDKTPGAREIETLITGALARSALVRSAALPARMAPLLVNKHRPGMSYGPHSDNPIMGEPPFVRTDVSVSVFLSDPQSYEGGELALRTEVGDAQFKLPRGDALLYPSGVLHSVRAVKSGERVCAVTWIQSLVADAAQRRLLFDLDRATLAVTQTAPDSDEARRLLRSYGNLVRMWSRG